MTGAAVSIETEIMQALATVTDPELDEPITDLGFVRSVIVDDDVVTVRLRLPTPCCSPIFAYLMASDAQDALREMEGISEVRVLLDDHDDSDTINAWLATNSGYVGTAGTAVGYRLDELRQAVLRNAHSAAMERCVSALVHEKELDPNEVHRLILRDLPDDKAKYALLRRRFALGLSMCPNARVVVDDQGNPLSCATTSMQWLRFAKSVRISMEGNGHFCRSLLFGGYDDAGSGSHVTDIKTRSSQ